MQLPPEYRGSGLRNKVRSEAVSECVTVREETHKLLLHLKTLKMVNGGSDGIIIRIITIKKNLSVDDLFLCILCHLRDGSVIIHT